MRPLSRGSSKGRASQKPLSAQMARRRDLRRQRRQTLGIRLWRLVAFMFLSGGLAWILLRHGWTLNGSDAVIVRGDAAFDSDQVIAAAQLRFPQPLLEIDPRTLEQKLFRALPVQSIQVERHMLPAQLIVTLSPQIPIARAERQSATGRERGLLNAEGQWIPLSDAAPQPETDILVRGWNEQHRVQIAELLRQRNRFEGMLKAVILEPDGDVSLITTRLGKIDLGGESMLLNTQIETILHLSKTLPEHLLKPGGSSLDLSNPERPELQLPTPPSSESPTVQP